MRPILNALSTLSVLSALLLAAMLPAGPALAETIAIDFTGNTLPAGWTLSGNGRIANERLEGFSTDRRAYITGDLGVEAERIEITFDGHFRNSYWGSHFAVRLYTDTSQSVQFLPMSAQYNWGNQTRIRFSGSGSSQNVDLYQSETFPNWRVNLLLEDNTASVSMTNLSNGSVYYSGALTDLPFDVSDIVSARFDAYHTNDSGQTWVDDIAIDMTPVTVTPAAESIPLPGAVLLLAAGLAVFPSRRLR